MRRCAAGEKKFSPSPCGRGLGGGAYATGYSRAGGTPPPNPLPKGEGENFP
jgi:hypothetical protein